MVGNSVNCHAEMSADISSIPSWKIALLEKRRFHDKESTGLNVSNTPSDQQAVADSGIPVWKRTILAKKQNQKNSSVFLAKHGQTNDSQSNDTVSTINNGYVHSLEYDSLLDNSTEQELKPAIVDIDINDTAEDQPVEERLLPIHQNPILRLDLKNRHHSSGGSAKSISSPRVTSTSTGSRKHSSGLSSVSSQAPVTPDAVNEEVFSNDNDHETEVAYGKGFVHKLLMKFSHLSTSTNDQTPNNRCSRQRLSSSCEPSDTGPPSGMPTAKFHSADDLLNETNFHVRIDRSDSCDELDITATNDVNGAFNAHLDHSDVAGQEDDVNSKRHSSCTEIADELPFANIVSSARSLFERLAVHSSSQKQSTSPSSTHNTAPSRFSYIGTLERSQHSKSKSVTKTYVPEDSTPKTFDQLYDSVNKSEKLSEVSHSNGTAPVVNGGESPRNTESSIEDDTNKSVQQSDNRTSSSAVVDSPSSPSCTYTRSSVFNRDVNISDASPSQPPSTHADLSTGENEVLVPKSTMKEQENESIPVASMTLLNTAADESHQRTNDTKSWTVQNTSSNIVRRVRVDSSSLASPLADKGNVKSQLAKKPAPSRPGKLLIRPASNLVAAKTSAEYLELTKFNDVRKGEFTPPVKKERIDPDVYDDDIDKADGVTDGSLIREEYVFDGAGIIIGRSMLTKTNRNRSVNAGNLSMLIIAVDRHSTITVYRIDRGRSVRVRSMGWCQFSNFALRISLRFDLNPQFAIFRG